MVQRMRGMEAGPGTDLRGLGWYLGIWVSMTAAMMLPPAAPMVLADASFSRTRPSAALVAAPPKRDLRRRLPRGLDAFRARCLRGLPSRGRRRDRLAPLGARRALRGPGRTPSRRLSPNRASG